MPEIKHNFTGGKMNKDLDERLIPNGQYRDAMNIQVSTSEGSDVGAVQNIMGNSLVPGQEFIGDNATCVGSIADEKNDKLYYFIHNAGNTQWTSETIRDTELLNSDYWEVSNIAITEDYSGTGVKISSNSSGGLHDGFYQGFELVHGRQYTFNIRLSEVDEDGDASSLTIAYFIYGDDSKGGSNPYRPIGHHNDATDGTHTHTFTFDRTQNNNLDFMRAYVQLTNGHIFNKSLRIEHMSLVEVGGSAIIEYDSKKNMVTPVFIDTGKVLDFDPNRLITGINIIDDMLFWTDNYSEPKKINIPRCIQGTDPSGIVNTKLINKAQDYNYNVQGSSEEDMEEEYVTVIKKRPLHAPTIQYSTLRDPDKTHSGVIKISDSPYNPNSFIDSTIGEVHDFSFLEVGDQFKVEIESDIYDNDEFILDWNNWMPVVLKEFDDGEAPRIPVSNYTIKGKITAWPGNEFSSAHGTEMLVNGNFENDSTRPGSTTGNGWSGVYPQTVTPGNWYWSSTYRNVGIQGSPGGNNAMFKTAQDSNGNSMEEGQTYKVSWTVGPPNDGSPLQGRVWVTLHNGIAHTVPMNGHAQEGNTFPNSYKSLQGTWGGAAVVGNYEEYVTMSDHSDYSGSSQNGPWYLWAHGGPNQTGITQLCFHVKTHGAGLWFNGSIDNVSIKKVDETKSQVEIRIDSVDGTPSSVPQGDTELKYVVDKFDTDKKIFENKFPRFAYRYKYEDGEYSAFSPFTEATFIPGVFDYHAKKGHNLGMVNNLKYLTLDLSRSLPKDAVSVDLLYKEEDSPNIYIVDTLKDLTNLTYTIHSETIRNGLASSGQLLRSWDNVPRKALAQDVVGNRVVYGNYLQNYDLIDNVSNSNYSALLDVDLTSNKNPSMIGVKSIKSLREYQVGVTYTDKYGRETPILTSPKASFKVGKESASEQVSVEVGLLNEGHPVNMKYFKFYIKDTGGEYYNLAMDRFYDAEDDNIWLAFPSTERNKVDIDDYLILKKGPGNISSVETNKWKIPNIVKEKAEFKIIDIKNEAPDFIKRKETRILSRVHDPTSNELFWSGDLPVENDAEFAIHHPRVAASAAGKLHEDFGKDADVEYHISLHNTDTNRVTDRYKILQLTAINDYWKFTLEKPFTNEINSFGDDLSGGNTITILDNTYLNIYKTAIANYDSHKFDGRFFVKIYNDDIFKRTIKEKVHDDNVEYKTMGLTRKIYSLNTISDTNRIEKHFVSNVTEAFKGIDAMDTTGSGGPSADADGLHHKVSDQPLHEDFNWGNYSLKTEEFARALGTLNGELLENNVSISTLLKDTRVWRDYDAYFRGINVYLGNAAIDNRVNSLDLHGDDSENQAFEDVWFIDKATCVGNFKNSSTSGDDTGWDTWPSKDSWNSLGYAGGKTIELAFGGIQPRSWSTDKTGWARDETFYDLIATNDNYSETQGDFVKEIAIGSQFRFKEDPSQTIYTITDVNTYLRVRYESLLDYSNHESGFVDKNPTGWKQEASWISIDSNGYAPLTANDLFPFHARSVDGYPSGLLQPGVSGTITWGHNIMGNAKIKEGAGLTTELYPTDGSESGSSGHTYYTSSYLRPSNYTKNWRITIDKPLVWNPVEDTSTELTGGKTIELRAPATVTVDKNSIVLTSLVNRASSDNNLLEVGMVLKKYNDGSDRVLATPAIVSKIETIYASGTTPPNSTIVGYTVLFKTYDGTTDLETGSDPAIDAITANNDLYFYQYPMNGLSRNSAKNLNYFRDGIGFDSQTAATAGTDAVGYTWEWMEEKSSRSEEEILPKNPAIWETKPKEDTDLDIYYEASGLIPIQIDLSNENIADIIPIGSTVEYEDKPGSIPSGTTVHGISRDNGWIILSNNVKIVDTPFNLVVGTAPGTGPGAQGTPE